MKINKILITNLGSYEGVNQIVVAGNPEKNIILVGGKNGAGKTTLFDSIRICLYGYKAYGYQLFSAAYKKQIDSMINDSAKLAGSLFASVSLELEIDDNQDVNKYVLTRSWSSQYAQFEEFKVKKNGILLDDELAEDFSNYLLGLIPPELFNLYFFDGEQIAEYFLGDEGGEKLKNAFLTLCGYDTLNIILDNFNRLVKSKKSDSKIADYVKNKDSFLAVKKEYEKLKEQEAGILHQLHDVEAELRENERTYRKKGGVSEEEWNSKIRELKQEEQNREVLNNSIKKMANDVIPFLILRSQIEELDSVINAESLHLDENTLNSIQEILPQLILGIPGGYQPNQKEARVISDYIISEIKAVDAKKYGERKLSISGPELSSLIRQINYAKALDKESVVENRTQLKSSIEKAKLLRSQLNNCSIEFIKKYQEKKTICESNRNTLTIQLEEIRHEISEKEFIKALYEQSFTKASKDLDEELKKNSVIDISSKAIVFMEDVIGTLVKSKKKQVEQAFVAKLNELKQKDVFISRVWIDDDFFIHAYKPVTKSSGEVEEVEIEKSRLSKGEKQVFIMALYWALMSLSDTEVPFMIDTPFARIDSLHREKITSCFFRQLPGQVFIFSTDEEIVGKHIDLLADKISDKYLLINKNNKRTQILKNCYFGDAYGI